MNYHKKVFRLIKCGMTEEMKILLQDTNLVFPIMAWIILLHISVQVLNSLTACVLLADELQSIIYQTMRSSG